MASRSFLSLSLFSALASLACGQADPSQAATLSFDSYFGVWSLDWSGVSDRTYFIQQSDVDLANWTFWPVIEPGTEAPISYRFWIDPPPERLFLRTVYTDQPAPDPYAADFDADGIPNGWEIEKGLDPFDAADAVLFTGSQTNLQTYQQAQSGGGDPAGANPVSLLVYSP